MLYRRVKTFVFSAFYVFIMIHPTLADDGSAMSNRITLEKAVHFTTAEGGDVVLDSGDYGIEPADEWLRITPSGATATDALLIEAHGGTHDQSLTAPLALSVEGEQPDTHYLVLLLPDGTRIETVGTYSGIRSRAGSSRLSSARLRAILLARQRATSTSTSSAEFRTPLFGGSGGNRSYNLDCGREAVMVGYTSKSGSWLDAIGIICQRVDRQTGNLGEQFTRGPRGGPGGVARPSQCPSGSVVGDILTRTGQFVNFVSSACFEWDASRKALGEPRRRSNGVSFFAHAGTNCLGNVGCNANGEFICPPGKAGKAIRGRHGIYIDSLRFVCDNWDR